jgi:alkanesulfonate monooxygenase SsuD/methylene tetrahydromethanopterin reductase-like flavin-dependent oxidoreductase (luciferase family)
VKIGITIPNAAPGVDAGELVEWGVRAEACGFEMVATIDRVVYPSHEQLVTLAAIASRTERIRLMTSTLLAPTRDPVLLAKQAATLDRISNGRLTLGLSVGQRPDDFQATGTDVTNRGRRFDEMLETMTALWRGESPFGGSRALCPTPTNGRVPIYFGGMSAKPRIVRRIAKWGDGFIAVGGPQVTQPIIEAINEAWVNEGREGKLVLLGASYFSLGEDESAVANIKDYYGDFMPGLGEMASAAMPRTADDIKRLRNFYEDAGFDEFLFSAAATNPDQVERLAEAVL